MLVASRGCPGSTCISPVWLERCKSLSPQATLPAFTLWHPCLHWGHRVFTALLSLATTIKSTR